MRPPESMRRCSRHRRGLLRAIGAATTALVICWLLAWSEAEAHDPLSGIFGPIEYESGGSDVPAAPHSPSAPAEHGRSGAPLIYLTFDGGTHPRWTPLVLEGLARHGVPATFFVVGERASTYPEVVAQVAADGHDIQNQTLNHRPLAGLSEAQFRHQILGGERSIQHALGDSSYRSSCVQPPWGGHSDLVFNRARALGRYVVTWDIDPRDWSRPGAERIARSILEQARPGAIVLLNEGGGREQTVEALDLMVPAMLDLGYRFALLCESASESLAVVSQPPAAEDGALSPQADSAASTIDVSAFRSEPHTPTDPATHSTTGEPLMYLTFDDGPHAYWTPRLLDLLARFNAPATFFVVGFKVLRYPELVLRMVEEGHNVSNHTLHHHRLDIANEEEFAHQVEGGDEAISSVLGDDYEIPCLRPPFGAVGPSTVARADALGKHLVMWDIDPRDWQRPGAQAIWRAVIGRAHPGAVVLFHEGGGGRQTYEALEVILTSLSADGYRFGLLCGDDRPPFDAFVAEWPVFGFVAPHSP